MVLQNRCKQTRFGTKANEKKKNESEAKWEKTYFKGEQRFVHLEVLKRDENNWMHRTTKCKCSSTTIRVTQ